MQNSVDHFPVGDFSDFYQAYKDTKLEFILHDHCDNFFWAFDVTEVSSGHLGLNVLHREDIADNTHRTAAGSRHFNYKAIKGNNPRKPQEKSTSYRKTLGKRTHRKKYTIEQFSDNTTVL